ncbi:MAG: L-histidine N(alpha)-methyltransferase [Acidimicrobiales bacterium]
MAPTASPPIQVHLSPEDHSSRLADDVRRGLTATPKQVPSKWLYDPVGCSLFEEICDLPEYYPTRAERAILAERARQIAVIANARAVVDLGSGTSEKTVPVLDALDRIGRLERFVGVDVAEPTLRQALAGLAGRYRELELEGVVADFELQLDRIPDGQDRLVMFLGGTIGNLDPAARHRFLTSLAGMLSAGEWFLVGTDLVKDPRRLVAAYDDAAGATAAFNRNVLSVLNTELGANFNPAAFDHVARWDAGREWIEMRLRPSRSQRVDIPALGLEVDVDAGEPIITEISAKFRPEGIRAELSGAGFAVEAWWTDRDRDFAVTLARRDPA